MRFGGRALPRRRVDRTRSLNLDGSGPVLRPGDPITVLYDRDVTVALTRPLMRPVPPDFLTGDILIGGSGRRLTVLFLRGPVLASATPVRRVSRAGRL